MDLSDILSQESVKVLAQATSKKRLLQDLAELASGHFGIDASDVLAALMEREELGPTAVGHGVALPHARLPELTHVMGLFVRLERSLEFGAADRQPVDLVFALFAPEDCGVQHLKALALVSRTLRDPAVRTKLRSNTDPSTLHMVLTAPQAQSA